MALHLFSIKQVFVLYAKECACSEVLPKLKLITL